MASLLQVFFKGLHVMQSTGDTFVLAFALAHHTCKPEQVSAYWEGYRNKVQFFFSRLACYVIAACNPRRQDGV